MVRKLFKKLTNNIGLKLLALVFAVVLWMAVVNLDDPTINRTFTVAVTIENESSITAQDKYYQVENDSGNVTFSVSGKRSIMDKLSSSDFKATADMDQMIQQGDKNIVPVEITAVRYSSQLTISRRSQELIVSLEDLMKAQFIIQPNATGTPADGYTLGDMSVTPNLLKVSGPKKVVEKISTVKAIIDVTGMATEITDSVVPVVLDENDEAMDTTQLTMNLSTVSVKAEILSEKTVSVKASYTGKPEDGFEVISLTVNPAQIQIKGESSVLNSVSMITIPKGVIQVDGVDRKFEQQVDITKYLPRGVSLSDSSQATVTIAVDIEELERRTFEVPVDNIEIDNLPEGYHIEYNKKNVEIVIYGLKNDLDELKASRLRPVLDVSGMSTGSHVGQLQLKLEGDYIVADTTISYVILTDNTDTDSGDDSDTDTEESVEAGNMGEGSGAGTDSTTDASNTTDADTDSIDGDGSDTEDSESGDSPSGE